MRNLSGHRKPFRFRRNISAPALHPRFAPVGEDAYREAYACAPLAVSGPTPSIICGECWMLGRRSAERPLR